MRKFDKILIKEYLKDMEENVNSHSRTLFSCEKIRKVLDMDTKSDEDIKKKRKEYYKENRKVLLNTQKDWQKKNYVGLPDGHPLRERALKAWKTRNKNPPSWRWSAYETNFLSENYLGKSWVEIGLALGKSSSSVRNKASDLGFAKLKRLRVK